jgi:hypothetical protein
VSHPGGLACLGIKDVFVGRRSAVIVLVSDRYRVRDRGVGDKAVFVGRKKTVLVIRDCAREGTCTF